MWSPAEVRGKCPHWQSYTVISIIRDWTPSPKTSDATHYQVNTSVHQGLILTDRSVHSVCCRTDRWILVWRKLLKGVPHTPIGEDSQLMNLIIDSFWFNCVTCDWIILTFAGEWHLTMWTEYCRKSDITVYLYCVVHTISKSFNNTHPVLISEPSWDRLVEALGWSLLGG